jgi:hypothetical protein
MKRHRKRKRRGLEQTEGWRDLKKHGQVDKWRTRAVCVLFGGASQRYSMNLSEKERERKCERELRMCTFVKMETVNGGSGRLKNTKEHVFASLQKELRKKPLESGGSLISRSVCYLNRN